jgi:hypothetical protein
MHGVVTLVEKDFLYGAAVLYNSLIKNGFKGIFFIGFRNHKSMPQDLLWCMKKIPTSFPRIEWIELNTDWHFTNYKPRFMLDLFKQYPQLTKITYFDPDIVFSGCPWNWLANWCAHGPVICADVNWHLPRNHPTRYEWEALGNKEGYIKSRDLDYYFNGGFLAIHRKDYQFLVIWKNFIKISLELQKNLPATGEIDSWRIGGRENLFHTPDQDSLNIAAMVWPDPIASLGPDAMGFVAGISLLPHAIGPNKPWRRNFLLDALKASPPRLVDKVFWSYTLNPITVFPRFRTFINNILISLSSFICRFYCKH